jgi:hypothetical protein
MAKPKDRIQFFLPGRYFLDKCNHHNGMQKQDMAVAFEKAFGVSQMAFMQLTSENKHGFDIICRPSQFGRFMVFRYEIGYGINGMKDLEPKLMVPEDMPAKIARVSGICREHVEKVINTLKFEGMKFDERCEEEYQNATRVRGVGVTIDVSKNFTHTSGGMERVCYLYASE